jgi:hypothetical protein
VRSPPERWLRERSDELIHEDMAESFQRGDVDLVLEAGQRWLTGQVVIGGRAAGDELEDRMGAQGVVGASAKTEEFPMLWCTRPECCGICGPPCDNTLSLTSISPDDRSHCTAAGGSARTLSARRMVTDAANER